MVISSYQYPTACTTLWKLTWWEMYRILVGHQSWWAQQGRKISVLTLCIVYFVRIVTYCVLEHITKLYNYSFICNKLIFIQHFNKSINIFSLMATSYLIAWRCFYASFCSFLYLWIHLPWNFRYMGMAYFLFNSLTFQSNPFWCTRKTSWVSYSLI